MVRGHLNCPGTIRSGHRPAALPYNRTVTGIPFRFTSPRRPIARELAVLLLTAAMAACSSNAGKTAPEQSAVAGAKAGSSPDIAAADGPEAFFHEQLVINGEDAQSEFGSALLTLGMNPRDLQQDTPEHAYQTVQQNLQGVKDDTLRRELTLALFGAAGQH